MKTSHIALMVCAIAAASQLHSSVWADSPTALPLSLVPAVKSSFSNESQQDLKEFQKAAIALALSKQKQSAFQFTPNEAMNFWDLSKKLSAPIEKRRLDYRHWLDKNNHLDTSKLWAEFVRKESEEHYKLFQQYLAAGEHCEARIYYGWIADKAIEKLAIRETYAVYIRSYEAALEQFRQFEKEQAGLTISCKSFDGKTSNLVRLVSEGVRPESAELAARLYADKDKSTVWPSFPSVALTFNLSDKSEGPWQNFQVYDIRHYDRTASDRMKQGLDWMTGRWGGSYDGLLQTKGLPAALDAFAANLEVTATTSSISFKDRETKVGFDLTRTQAGLVYIIKRSHFLKRCTVAADREAVESAPLVPDGPASGKPGAVKPGAADVSLSNNAPHAKATVTPGGTLKVHVSVAGGTGYKLHLVTPPENAVASSKGPTVEGPASKKLGAPSIHHFEFRLAAAPPPEFRLVFRLLRPGQSTGPEYDVTVSAQSAK